MTAQRPTAHRLALTAVDLACAEHAAGHAAGRPPGPAVLEGAVVVEERGGHEVALADASDVGARLFHDADQLVVDGAGLERRLAAVVPEVRAAHAGPHDPHDGIGVLLHDRVGPVGDLYVAGSVEDSSSHGDFRPLDVVCPVPHASKPQAVDSRETASTGVPAGLPGCAGRS